MYGNTERFLEAFNKFENALKIKLGKDRFTPFAKMIREGASKDKFIRYYEHLLEGLSDLRNVIVHKEGGKIIATPSDYAVATLEAIVEEYIKPKTIEEISKHNVSTLRAGISLKEALEHMKKVNFTKLPVYRKKDYVGLFTSAIFTRWYLDNMNNDVLNLLNSTNVEDILPLRDDVTFIRKNMTVYEFIDLMGKRPTKSGIYLLTEHGKRTERPVAILTSFDYKEVIDSITFMNSF